MIVVIAQAVPPGRVELAAIVREHASRLTGLSPTQQHVLRAIADCRTAALGGHRRAGAPCGHQEGSSNACRDRHCPKCQGLEAARWMDARQRDLLPVPYFHFLPVRVLAEVFRGKLLATLEQALDRAEIPPGRDDDPHALLTRAATKRWVVYCKPPFAGPEQVVAYLARDTHRIALSNDRWVSRHDDQVTFRWTDRAHGNAPRVTTLEAETFLRRFLLHVLPDRFVRIRHYGWLANSARTRLLPTVREVLGLSAPVACTPPPVESDTWEATLLRLTGKDVTRGPCCGAGGFRIVEALPARAQPGDFPLRLRSP